MKERLVETVCPFCGSQYHLKVHTYEIAGHSRKTDDLLASGSYFRHCCGTCGQIFVVMRPVMYRIGKDTMIVLSRQKQLPDFDCTHVYVYRDVESFSEGVRILLAGLEPEQVEAVKERLGRPVRFQEEADGYWWFSDGISPLAVKI